jgi:hypothetical protein
VIDGYKLFWLGQTARIVITRQDRGKDLPTEVSHITLPVEVMTAIAKDWLDMVKQRKA